MLSTRDHCRKDNPPIRCPLCSRTGHSTLKCRDFQITRREKKPNGYQRDGEHDGNGGGGRNGGGGGNGRGGESGGVGGNRGAEAVNITAGGAVSRRKVARIPNTAIRPFPPLLFMSRTPQSLGMPKPLCLCDGTGHSQLPTWRISWVVSASTLGPGCSTSQALSRLGHMRRTAREA